MGKRSDGFVAELLHFGAVRMRITGAGAFKQTFFSLDDTTNYVLPDLTLVATTNREPTQLANFIDQRALLEGKVIWFDNNFSISRIFVFVKPIAAEYPR